MPEEALFLLPILIVTVALAPSQILTGFARTRVAARWPRTGVPGASASWGCRRLCEHGVQRGWHARQFESLEEWRSTGDYLRFRLFGELTAAPCPHALQAHVRAKLVQLAPERESPCTIEAGPRWNLQGAVGSDISAATRVVRPLPGAVRTGSVA